MIQSAGFLRGMLGSLDSIGKKAITHLAIPFVRDNIPGIVTNLASNVTSNKNSKNRKRFLLFISNEDLNDVIKIIKSL